MRNLILAVLFLTSTIALADDKKPQRPERPQVKHGERGNRPTPRASNFFYPHVTYNHPQGHVRHSNNIKGKSESPEHRRYNAPPQHNRYYRSQVGFRPVIRWFPNGLYLNIGPSAVSGDRRHIRFGINAGFYQTPRFHTFNYHR